MRLNALKFYLFTLVSTTTTYTHSISFVFLLLLLYTPPVVANFSTLKSFRLGFYQRLLFFLNLPPGLLNYKGTYPLIGSKSDLWLIKRLYTLLPLSDLHLLNYYYYFYIGNYQWLLMLSGSQTNFLSTSLFHCN